MTTTTFLKIGDILAFGILLVLLSPWVIPSDCIFPYQFRITLYAILFCFLLLFKLDLTKIGEKTLMHELMHAYQDVFYTYKTMCANIFNMELETYLFVDVTWAMYFESFDKLDSITVGSNCSEDLETNIEDFINSIIKKGYINDEDLGTYSLIGEKWDKVFGTFNDNFPPEILKEMFNYKPE